MGPLVASSAPTESGMASEFGRKELLRMKKAFVAMAATLLIATASFAHYVDVDLDGTIDGVDYIQVNQSTNVVADVWLLGEGPCWWVCGVYLCNGDHNLGYLSTVYNTPGGGWGFVAPQPPDANGCITLQGQNFTFDIPMCAPWKLATVTYHAAVDQHVADLTLDTGSGVLTVDFVTSSFTNNGSLVGEITIGQIVGVEETNWGAVKSLFR